MSDPKNTSTDYEPLERAGMTAAEYEAFVAAPTAGNTAVLSGQSNTILPRNEDLYETVLEQSQDEELAQAALEEWQQHAIGNLQSLNQAMRQLKFMYQNTGDLQWQVEAQTGEAYLNTRPDIANALENAIAKTMGWKGEEISQEIANGRSSLRIDSAVMGNKESLDKLAYNSKALFDNVKEATKRSVGFTPSA